MTERIRTAEQAPSTDPAYVGRSIALLLHDGLRFTAGPLTSDQRTDLMVGLRLVAMGNATTGDERRVFQLMLDHGWRTTAPYRGGAAVADRTPAEHAATVREALISWGTHMNQYKRREECLAALDALEAQAERGEVDRRYRVALIEERRAAIRRAEAAESENAVLRKNIKDEAVQTILAKEYGSSQFSRAEAAEAERDAALDREAGTSDALEEMRAERDRLAALVAELGNELARERSRPEGTFDQWARLQQAEERVAKLEAALRPFAENWDFRAADYLAERIDGVEMRVLDAATVTDIIAAVNVARAALATDKEQQA